MSMSVGMSGNIVRAVTPPPAQEQQTLSPTSDAVSDKVKDKVDDKAIKKNDDISIVHLDKNDGLGEEHQQQLRKLIAIRHCNNTTTEYNKHANRRKKNRGKLLPQSFIRDMEPRYLRDRIKAKKTEIVVLKQAGAEGRKIANIEEELEGFQFCLEKREHLLNTEYFIKEPSAIVAAYVSDADDGGWLVVRIRLIPTSAEKDFYVVISVDETFIKSFIRSHVIDSKRFSNGFRCVRKYDRDEFFNSVEWTAARFLGGDTWELRDKNGASAETKSQFVDDDCNMCADDKANIMRKYQEAAILKCKMEFVNLRDGSYVKATNRRKNNNNLPPMAYKSTEGKHDCVPKCLASVLHYLGDDCVAKSVITKVTAWKGNDPLKLCAKALLDHGISMKFHRIKKDNLVVNPNEVFIASMRGKHNGVKHSIAITRGLIFDSNQLQAMPFSLESLNIACGGSGFCAFKSVKRLVFTQDQINQQRLHLQGEK